jgi:hypothetical protein
VGAHQQIQSIHWLFLRRIDLRQQIERVWRIRLEFQRAIENQLRLIVISVTKIGLAESCEGLEPVRLQRIRFFQFQSRRFVLLSGQQKCPEGEMKLHVISILCGKIGSSFQCFGDSPGLQVGAHLFDA